MCRKDIAAVVTLALYLSNHIEALVILQKLVVYICTESLNALYSLRCHP